MVTTPDATVWGPPLMYHVGDPVTATNVQRVSCAACAPTQHLQKTAFGRLRARYVLCTIPVNCMTVFWVYFPPPPLIAHIDHFVAVDDFFRTEWFRCLAVLVSGPLHGFRAENPMDESIQPDHPV